MLALLFLIFNILIICYAVVINSVYFSILLLSFKNIFTIARHKRYEVHGRIADSTHMPPVSVLVPAYNEEVTIIDSVKSLIALHYPIYEVIVINDGSTDQTLHTLIKELNLYRLNRLSIPYAINCTKVDAVYYNPEYPFLYVIDKENGGKGDALNAGINFSHYSLICAIDADSLLEKDALVQIATMYMTNPKQYIGIGGMIRVANGCKIENGAVQEVRLPKKWWPMFQTFEYLRALLARIGWSSINGLFIISGAFGLFDKDYVIKVGGYPRNAHDLSEDLDMSVNLHRYMLENQLPYRIGFCPEAVCWTQVPHKHQNLSNQRHRWERAIVRSIINNYDMLRPKYKIFGLLTLPFIIVETLNPYFQISSFFLFTVLVLYDINNGYSIVILVLMILWSLLLGVGSLLLEEIAFKRYVRIRDQLRMLAFNILVAVGYQWSKVWWQLQSHVKFLQGNYAWKNIPRESWSEVENKSTLRQ